MAQQTTIHGLGSIFNSKTRVQKLIWLVLSILSLAALSFLVTDTLNNFYKYQVFTSIGKYSEMTSEFPVIGFCDLNQLSSPNAINLWKEKASNVFNTKNRSESDYDFFSQKTLDYHVTVEIYHNLILGLNPLEQKSLLQPLNETVISCTYNLQKCDLNDFSWFYHDFYGACFSFRTNQSSKRSGRFNGLHLELFLKGNLIGSDLEEFSPRTEGLHVFVFNKSLLLPITSGIDVASGLETSISMDRTFTKRLGDPYNKCNNFVSALYNQTIEKYSQYHQNQCFLVCFFHEVDRFCNCSITHPNVGDEHLIRCSSLEDLKCINEAYSIVFNDENKYCGEDCPAECDTNDIGLSLSSTLYPTESHARFILKNSFIKREYPGMTETRLRSHMLSLNFYYENLAYYEITESPQYTWSDIVSSIGGSLGLCLGASLLSIVELLGLTTHFISFLFRKNILQEERDREF